MCARIASSRRRSLSCVFLWNFYHNFHCFYRSLSIHISRSKPHSIDNWALLCIYLISVFSHSEICGIDRLLRGNIANKSCVSVVHLSAPLSCIIKIKFCAIESCELSRGRARELDSLKRESCPSTATRSGQPNSMEREAQGGEREMSRGEKRHNCGYFIGIINILSIVFSLSTFLYSLLRCPIRIAEILNFFCVLSQCLYARETRTKSVDRAALMLRLGPGGCSRERERERQAGDLQEITNCI